MIMRSWEVMDEQVLELREVISTINDDYKLKKSGEFSECEETLLVVSLMMVPGLIG
jgi:hypothetical protein